VIELHTIHPDEIKYTTTGLACVQRGDEFIFLSNIQAKRIFKTNPSNALEAFE